MKKIIAYNRLDSTVLEKLSAIYDVEYFENIDPKNNTVFLNSLKQAEGIIGLDLPVDKDLLDKVPSLKIVSNVSTGYNNLDIGEMTKRNILATNTPGIVEDTTADLIMGIMISAARRISELDRYMKEGKWTNVLPPNMFGVNIHKKTLGIIGMGKIGTKIAKRAHLGFDMDILYHNRSRNFEIENEFNANYCSMEFLLENADFVCVMTPLSPETYHLIGEKEFKLMKETCIFINGSRGHVVDEEALIFALENKEIYGAALDVFQMEPINPDNPLLKLDNVVTTPHIGSSTYETELEMSKTAYSNLISGLTGERPANLINPEAFPNWNSAK